MCKELYLWFGGDWEIDMGDGGGVHGDTYALFDILASQILLHNIPPFSILI